jgi:hypothetical protein
MGYLKSALQWAGRKLRRLPSLVKDEDHDSWYDDHPGGQTMPKPPRITGRPRPQRSVGARPCRCLSAELPMSGRQGRSRPGRARSAPPSTTARRSHTCWSSTPHETGSPRSDNLPQSRWAKTLMASQSVIALSTTAVVVYWLIVLALAGVSPAVQR